MKKLLELLRRKGIQVPDNATPDQLLALARQHKIARSVTVPADSDKATREVDLVITKADEGKSADDAARDVLKFEGVASTPELDLQTDIVMLSAWPPALAPYLAKGTLLLNHRHNDTIGKITSASVDEDREELRVAGEIYRDCIEEIEWNRIKRRLKSSLSVGIRVLEFEVIETDDFVIFVITKLQLLEISVCTIPANESAGFNLIGKNYEVLAKVTPRTKQGSNNGGDSMKEMLIKFLRGKGITVADDVDDATLLALVSNLEKAGRGTVLVELGLGADANLGDVKTKLAGVTSGDLVPKADLVKREQELATLRADAAVKQALEDGIIDNTQLEWAKSYAAENPTGFEKFCTASGKGSRVPLDTLTGKASAEDPRASDVAGKSTKAELEVSKRLGIDVAKMNTLAGTKPSEVIGKIFSGVFKNYLFATDTEYDQEVLTDRKAFESPRRAA